MEHKYEYGPDIDFDITTVGEMREHNGRYDDLNENGQYLLQAICHMVYQIKSEFHDEVDTIQLNGVWVMKAKNSYALYTTSMMTVFNIIETGKHSFEVEFLSPTQFTFADPFIEYARIHAIKHGKAE